MFTKIYHLIARLRVYEYTTTNIYDVKGSYIVTSQPRAYHCLLHHIGCLRTNITHGYTPGYWHQSSNTCIQQSELLAINTHVHANDTNNTFNSALAFVLFGFIFVLLCFCTSSFPLLERVISHFTPHPILFCVLYT